MEDKHEKFASPSWSRDVDLGEMMMFVSILLQMSLQMNQGKAFDRDW